MLAIAKTAVLRTCMTIRQMKAADLDGETFICVTMFYHCVSEGLSCHPFSTYPSIGELGPTTAQSLKLGQLTLSPNRRDELIASAS
jgi:hypothetical protein